MALLAFLMLAVPLAAQSPVFRAATEAVEVDVRVTDRDGQPVTGLTADDFELREDGRVQAITSVNFVGLEPSRTVSADAAPSTSIRLQPDLEGRVYVLVLDDLHVDAPSSARVVSLASEFLQRVMPADRVTVRFTGGGAGLAGWSNRASELLPAVRRFVGRKLPAAALEESERRSRARELSTWTSTADRYARERAMNARAAMSTLREAAASLAGVRGRRKAILFFSEGIDYDITDAIGRIDQGTDADTIVAAMQQAMAAANQTNASFYSIDPRGAVLNASDIAGTGSLDREATRALREEMVMSHASLREVADTTGGFAAVNMNDLRGFFDRVVADNDAYYMLSYAPPGGRKAGFRKIEVRVKKRGLRVRARPGYLSTAPPAVTIAEAPPPGPAAATTAATPVEAEPADPVPDADLATVLARTARYVETYQQNLAGIVAEERYQQNVVNMAGPMRTRGAIATTPQRDLRSDLLLVRPAGEESWMQFRDVFEVDGRAIRDRDERLYRLFVEPTPSSHRQAEILQAESARYNLGPLTRTINVPMMALAIADAARQPSFRFKRVKTDPRDLAERDSGAEVWAIEYRETGKGTMIRGAANRDLPSRGRLWVEGATGRVLRTELISDDVQVKAEITVNYRAQAGLDLLAPVEMREDYALPQLGIRIVGRATYSRFRRFTVSTSEKPKPQ
jgi:VWFA-related protein